jgi:hypothetical protein
MSRLRILQVWIATVMLSAGVVVVPGVVASSTQTFTGKVSDAMCGAKHSEGNIAPADWFPTSKTMWMNRFFRAPKTTAFSMPENDRSIQQDALGFPFKLA